MKKKREKIWTKRKIGLFLVKDAFNAFGIHVPPNKGAVKKSPDVIQRSRGLSRSPSNYEEFVWKRYFPTSEWDQNRTRSSVALNINTGLSLVAIVYLLWLPHSHNMADFHAILAYFYHLFDTAVTVTNETGTSGVLNLPHT